LTPATQTAGSLVLLLHIDVRILCYIKVIPCSNTLTLQQRATWPCLADMVSGGVVKTRRVDILRFGNDRIRSTSNIDGIRGQGPTLVTLVHAGAGPCANSAHSHSSTKTALRVSLLFLKANDDLDSLVVFNNLGVTLGEVFGVLVQRPVAACDIDKGQDDLVR